MQMPKNSWTFLTSHAAVLILLAQQKNLTARRIGSILNITSRSVYRIIRDLENEGYIKIFKQGRENRYQVNKSLPLRRHYQRDVQVQDLLNAISNS
jgi:sugar-specific transcriptional regulator TrmB